MQVEEAMAFWEEYLPVTSLDRTKLYYGCLGDSDELAEEQVLVPFSKSLCCRCSVGLGALIETAELRVVGAEELLLDDYHCHSPHWAFQWDHRLLFSVQCSS